MSVDSLCVVAASVVCGKQMDACGGRVGALGRAVSGLVRVCQLRRQTCASRSLRQILGGSVKRAQWRGGECVDGDCGESRGW